jgi:hypothetical protein
LIAQYRREKSFNIGGNRSIRTRYATDIITIARAWCVAKDWGYLRIGVQYGDETIQFTAGRRYDKVRYPYLITNWRKYYQGYGIQRPYVFRKNIYT